MLWICDGHGSGGLQCFQLAVPDDDQRVYCDCFQRRPQKIATFSRPASKEHSDHRSDKWVLGCHNSGCKRTAFVPSRHYYSFSASKQENAKSKIQTSDSVKRVMARTEIRCKCISRRSLFGSLKWSRGRKERGRARADRELSGTQIQMAPHPLYCNETLLHTDLENRKDTV